MNKSTFTEEQIAIVCLRATDHLFKSTQAGSWDT